MGLLETLTTLLLLAPPVTQFPAWDQFFVKPAAPLVVLAPAGELTLLVYHSYPESLHELTVRALPGALTGERAVTVDALEPTVLRELPLSLRRTATASGDTATVRLEFAARELAAPRTLELELPLTPAGAQRLNAALAVPVGELPVLISKRAKVTYALQIAGLLAMLAWWWYRKRGANRMV
ncbi:MAG: hypothetical protein IT204_16870 [Fimbriimonadaceae bacterium]|nr:hypothetical protein [Fimbriimonadaceae bacterium]